MNTITITLTAHDGVDLEEAYYQLQLHMYNLGLEEV